MSNDQYEKCKQLFLTGISLEKIAYKECICAYTLGKKLKIAGYKIVRNNQKYIYIDSYFDNIDTEIKAYWLGFLYADGCVSVRKKCSVLDLCLCEKDITHLYKFKSVICDNIPVTVRRVKLGNKTYTAGRVIFCSSRLCSGLISKGCKPNKSLTLQFPTSDQVPTILLKHFIRGFFDGDGSVYNTGASLCCGNLLFLKTVQDFFVKEIPGYTERKIAKDKRYNVYSFSKNTPRAALKFLHYLYAGATIFLDRKYKKYLQLCQHVPKRAEMSFICTEEKNGNSENENPALKVGPNKPTSVND